MSENITRKIWNPSERIESVIGVTPNVIKENHNPNNIIKNISRGYQIVMTGSLRISGE